MAGVGFPPWDEETSLDDYLSGCEQVAAATGKSVLPDCVRLLEAFVGENFLGPPTPADQPVPSVHPVGAPLSDSAHKRCIEHLYVDGEVVPVATRRPLLLLVALRAIGNVPDTPVAALWRLRTLFVHQRVLSRLTHSLRRRSEECIKTLSDAKDLSELSIPQAQAYLEMGYVYSHYREVDKAQRMFFKARELTGLTAELGGELGVRTEHQSFKTAQLVVRTTSRLLAEPPTTPHPGAQIRTIQSELCDVLQRPSQRNVVFREVDPTVEPADGNLAVLDQAVLLSLCLNVRNNNPHHGLTGREMLAYVERVMGCTNMPYAVECMCLTLKAKVEWERSRVQERALLQLQEMVDTFMAEDGDQQARLPWFWGVPLPSNVGMLKDLGRRYLKLGMNKTAEGVAEILQDWPFVVTCCLKQGNAKRAERIATDLLNKEPDDPLHWCALAEATSSKEHYLTAWEKSHHKLAAPMRGLARLCVERQEWEESIEYFDHALGLNPLYGGNWFTLGVACQRTARYQRAAQAFIRVVMLEPEEGEAWNNLGAVYLQLGNKRQALSALTMAAKLMEWSWQVRENHFRIAAELGEWQTAVHDLTLLLDQRGHQYAMNIEDLRTVVRGMAQILLDTHYTPVPEEAAVTTLVEESEDGIPKLVVTPEPGHVPLPIGSLRERMEEFLVKLNGTYTDNVGIYDVIAEFYATVKEYRRAYEFRLKQDRAARLVDWRHDPERFAAVAAAAKGHSDVAAIIGDLGLIMQSARLVANTLKGAAEDLADHPALESLRAVQVALDGAARLAAA